MASANYYIDNRGTEFCTLTPAKRARVLNERLQRARQLKLLDENNFPLQKPVK